MTQSDLPSPFWLGIEQFNQRQFYACHDTLEALWMDAIDPEKTFYQGILQIAVAFYHLGNQNWQGTVTLLGEGIQRLSAFPSGYGAVDVDQLINQSASLLRMIQQAGPDEIEAIAHQLDTNVSETPTYPTIHRCEP